MKKPLLSVVITVYNEEDNIQPLLQATYAALSGMDYEVILVEDGSTDRTVAEVKKYANTRTKLVIFNRNYGQTTALAAGIDQATGQYIATMDGDLQNDPTDIPVMLQKQSTRNGMWWQVVEPIEKMDLYFGKSLPKLPIGSFEIPQTFTSRIMAAPFGCTRPTLPKTWGFMENSTALFPCLPSSKAPK